MSFFKDIFFKKQSFGAPEGYNVSLSPCRDQGGRWIAMGNKPEREEGQGVGRELAVWGWGSGGQGGRGRMPFLCIVPVKYRPSIVYKNQSRGAGRGWGEMGGEGGGNTMANILP